MASKSCRLHFLLREEGGREREDERPWEMLGLVIGEPRGELASSYTRTALSEGLAVSLPALVPNTTSMFKALLGDISGGDSGVPPILPPGTGMGWMPMMGAG